MAWQTILETTLISKQQIEQIRNRIELYQTSCNSHYSQVQNYENNDVNNNEFINAESQNNQEVRQIYYSNDLITHNSSQFDSNNENYHSSDRNDDDSQRYMTHYNNVREYAQVSEVSGYCQSNEGSVQSYRYLTDYRPHYNSYNDEYYTQVLSFLS